MLYLSIQYLFMSVLKYKYLSLMFVPPPTLYHRGLRLFNVKPSPVVAKNPEHLRSLVTEQIRIYGEKCDLNHIDVSHIDDMSGIFSRLPFNGDISRWTTSHVTDMSEMFSNSPFQGDISRWDVSKVLSMARMFDGSLFDGDISGWNVSKVVSMRSMFRGSRFNRSIDTWDVSRVLHMESMFADSKFNRTLSSWNVSRVEYMQSMFRESDFHGDLSKWDVSNVKDMRCMFEGSTYERDISAWQISPECNIQDAAPKYYGESPLFLACALADGQFERPRGIRSSRYEEAYAMMETLGAKGIEAGYAMFQIMRGQPGLVTVPTCELNDFS